MARGNFDACLAVSLVYEGGWSDHPKDPGGATMKGITLARYRQDHPGASKVDLRAISNAEVKRIYRVGYWDKVRGDDLPYGVDLVTNDFGINSGPSRSVRYLQAALGVRQDGAPGRETLAAARAADGKALVQRLCAKRMSFLQGLPTWSTFKRGWSRRVADVEARGVAMWLSKGAALSKPAREELTLEAERAKEAAKKQDGAAAGSGMAGGGGAVAGGDVNWIVVALVVVAVVAVVGYLIYRSRHNKERAKAYAAVAAGR